MVVHQRSTARLLSTVEQSPDHMSLASTTDRSLEWCDDDIGHAASIEDGVEEGLPEVGWHINFCAHLTDIQADVRTCFSGYMGS